MTLPVYNLQAPIVDPKTGKLVSPWNMFFQQLVQAAPAVVTVTTPSPFTANANGTVILTGAATVDLIRGTDIINLNGQRIIPVSVGDSVAWTGPATVQFLGVQK